MKRLQYYVCAVTQAVHQFRSETVGGFPKKRIQIAIQVASLCICGGLTCAQTSPPDQPALAQDSAASTARKGLDYSSDRPPDPAAINKDGYSFVFRYLSPDPTKNLTLAEAQKLIGWGIDVGCVWEAEAKRPLKGKEQGVSDAKEAQSQAIARGMPADRPIYFAVDWDAAPGEQEAINAYFDGVVSVIGLDRCGAYAGYYVLKRLFDAGKIRWGWQTLAWSGGQWESRAHVRQVQAVFVGGVACDLDEALADDFGQWGTEHDPAMASFQGRLYLAWRDARTNRLNLMYAQNGGKFGHRYTSTETSPEPPTLGADTKALYIGWTGLGNNKLNVAHVVTAPNGAISIPGTSKTTLQETSPRRPALASLNGRLFLAWKDLHDHLNLMYASNGHNFGHQYISKETSTEPPALAADGSSVYVGWTGVGNNELNVAQVLTAPDGAMSIPTTSKTTLHETSPRSPALTSFQGRLFLAWEGRDTNHYLNLMYSGDGGHTFAHKYTATKTASQGADTSQDAPVLCTQSSGGNFLYIGWKGNGNDKLNVAQVELQGGNIKVLPGQLISP